ncbi:Mis6-domain-containing protein [Parathielavia appendiculata]|uniref:Mis6-domain-containing protein n=1 Tax=Parathielavia appendiculata TaxID=2587402 RepID=A0AAN6U729_9PEZI|nr:Mis6-domain-containing protein [Parathielavia appendiculata]
MSSPGGQVFDNLDGLIEDLETASTVPAKRRKTGIKSTIEKTTATLYETGALPDELARLVDLLTIRNFLDQASLGAIVRNLYPSGKVSDEVVLRFLGALGHGQLKPSLYLQALFLRWLVMVYHLLENSAVLSQAYGVLFNLLDTAAIRPQLCHLLALVTRRKHVRPFRIQAILNLSRQTSGDPNLTGLLRVFKNYYPEVIVGDITKGRAASFKHPDPQWRARLDEIQKQRSEREADPAIRNGFAVSHDLGRRLKGTKHLFPTVHTMHAQESSVTLEEIDNAESFVKKLEKIELPTQLVAVLADPLLQKLLLLRPDAEGFSRISNWLMACLGDVASGDADSDIFLDILEVIHDYAVATNSLSPLLLTFFAQFLEVWDGSKKRDVVVETLSFAPVMKFEELYRILRVLEQSMLDNTPSSQVSLLRFYTLLLRRWTITMEAAERLDALPADTVPNLIGYVNQLTLTLTQTSPTVGTFLDIIDFYEAAATLYSKPKLIEHIDITIPPPLLVYLLYFSPSLAVVSRLCGILTTYKRAWEAVMSPAVSRGLTRRERDQINVFNGFLMDLCNCLWRGRAFSTTDANAQGCRITQQAQASLGSYLSAVDPDLGLATAFGLSHSPLLCLQSISHVRELEDAEMATIRTRHAGPVTEASLGQLAHRGGLRLSWQEYRSGVLAYMEAKGFPGIPNLMYNTMKKLMSTRQH